MTIGERIRQLRKANNMTQGELGALVGLQNSAIHKYERGIVTDIPLSKIEALANALNTTPEDLLGITEQPEDLYEPAKKCNVAIGAKIKKLRKKHNMTAEALGVAIGKDRATVYRYENGELDDPPISIVLSLCEALCVTPGDLLGLTPPEPTAEDGMTFTLTRHDLYTLWHLTGVIEGLVVQGGQAGIADDLTFVSDQLTNILVRIDPDPNEERKT